VAHVVVSLNTSLLTNQFLFSKLPYDPQRDLALVARLASAPVVLVVGGDVPVRNAQELVQYVKSNKGKLAYGSWGNGSYAHLAGAYMSKALDADMSHIAYKGEAPMLQELLGGQIQMVYASAASAKPHIDSGKLKAVGVTGDQRMPVLPNVPTLVEQGLKDDAYRLTGWVALAAPAKTPADIVQRLAKEVAAVSQAPDVRERIVAMGFIPLADTPEGFQAAYRRDAPMWEALVKSSGAKLD
jgi:tripartite-type tricarboxylate transporter receptor subunit TctC